MFMPTVPLSPESLKARLLHWASTSPRYPFFKGTSQDLKTWFSIVERACDENEVSEMQYAEAAIVFIQGDLALVMEERRLRYIETSGEAYWAWDDFKDDIRRVILEAERIMEERSPTPLDKTKAAFNRLREEHPYVFASAGSALMIGGSFVIIPALGILTLNALGFTATGVAGGSFAAIVQSIFYRGATTGLFSILQSAGATAVAPAIGALAGASSAVGAGLASLVYGAKGSSDETPASAASGVDDPPPPYPGLESSPKSVPYAVYRPKRSYSTYDHERPHS